MADKNWQAGGKNLIPAQALLCLIVTAAPVQGRLGIVRQFCAAELCRLRRSQPLWEVLIGGIVVCSFLAAVALWIHSALRKAKRLQLRRNAFVSSALNNLSHGVVMTDAQQRIVFCNDRYLEIYGLTRSDIPRNMTAPQLLELRRKRGVLDISTEDFFRHANRPEGPDYRTARRAFGSGQALCAAERRGGGDP